MTAHTSPFLVVLADWLRHDRVAALNSPLPFATILELVTRSELPEEVRPLLLDLMDYIYEDTELRRTLFLDQRSATDPEHIQMHRRMRTLFVRTLMKLGAPVPSPLRQTDDYLLDERPPYKAIIQLLRGTRSQSRGAPFCDRTLIAFAEAVEFPEEYRAEASESIAYAKEVLETQAA